jgi:hypothetical protein
MVFPRGFTGFGSDLPQIDVSGFKASCFELGRRLDGDIAEFKSAELTPNFHFATIRWDHGRKTASVLCNRQYWMVGFCEAMQPNSCRLQYIDVPQLAEVLRRISDWTLISKAELESPLDAAALASMHETDRQTIDHARRKRWFSPANTVGDAVFNYWD